MNLKTEKRAVPDRTDPERSPDRSQPAPVAPIPRPRGPLRFKLDKTSRTPLYEQIREQIISALHMGQVQPGSKLPSVRQFARIHQVNPKTIHRIYRRLGEDGYVRLRAGSGAYIAPVQRGTVDGDRLLSLHRFFQHTLEECGRMGLNAERSAELFGSFVSRQALWNAQLTVVECNREHVDLLAHELRGALGVRANPVLLDSLECERESVLGDARVVVTTEYHFEAVRDLAAGSAQPVLQVQLHPDFVPGLMQAAENGRLLMVVSDTTGLESFTRAMSLLGLSRAASRRVRLVEAGDPVRVRDEASRADSIYVSPLVEKSVATFLPPGARRLVFEHHISPESLDLVESALLFGESLPPE